MALLLLALTVGAGLWICTLAPVSLPRAVEVLLPPGSSVRATAAELEGAGVIRSARAFALVARLRGDDRRIRAGEYRFSGSTELREVLDRLVAGDVVRHQTTVPEGLRLTEIAQRLKDDGFAPWQTFLTLATDQGYVQSLGIEANSLEGYLFPETYTFVRGTTAQELIAAMLAQLQANLSPELEQAAADLGLNRHQLLTLASIIQKEAGHEGEMPRIAAVFHNRLRRGMRLQTDPTVIYGIADFDGNLTRRHLRQATAYNTYVIPGLPPGPIAAAGRAALEAAAHPASGKELYFVSRGDGSHVFSETLEQHNRAVRRYQLRR